MLRYGYLKMEFHGYPGFGLQTRPLGKEVKSADLDQSALERVPEGFSDIGAKGLLHWRTLGCTGANLACPGASHFRRLLVIDQNTLVHPTKKLSVICIDRTLVQGALACKFSCSVEGGRVAVMDLLEVLSVVALSVCDLVAFASSKRDLKRCNLGVLKENANAIWGIACQNSAYLAAICDLELRFRATTGRGAIWEIAFGRPLRRLEVLSAILFLCVIDVCCWLNETTLSAQWNFGVPTRLTAILFSG